MFIALHGKALVSALVVGILFEKSSAPNAAVQDVKDHSARRVARTSWHEMVLIILPSFVKFGDCHLSSPNDWPKAIFTRDAACRSWLL
jgi:hypothetical protein